MGFLQRRADKSAAKFWDEARPVMGRTEEPVFYAHMRCQDAQVVLPGTLFLTNQQVIWRAHAPGLPKGAGFQYPVQSIRGLGRAGNQDPERGEFALFMEPPGRETAALLFGPARPNAQASILLANEMAQHLRAAHKTYGQPLDQSHYES